MHTTTAFIVWFSLIHLDLGPVLLALPDPYGTLNPLTLASKSLSACATFINTFDAARAAKGSQVEGNTALAPEPSGNVSCLSSNNVSWHAHNQVHNVHGHRRHQGKTSAQTLNLEDTHDVSKLVGTNARKSLQHLSWWFTSSTRSYGMSTPSQT